MNENIISKEIQQIKTNLERNKVNLPIGKLIRSKLGFLMLKALNQPINDNHINFLTAIELIHNASLLHDDVIDNDKTRRNELSKNELLGNKTAILLGNLTLTNAVEYLLKTNSLQLISIINNTIQQMCKGELIQKAQENNIPTIEDYIQKTYLKTGTLFEGTIKGVLEISTIKNSKLIDFAKNIGILFQINNDIKNLEKDITNGIYTLPIIFSNSINISKNSIEKTLSLIDNYTSNAIQALSCLGESEYKKSLIGVVECLKISEINITNLEKNTQI